MTGSPSIASRTATKSARCATRSSSSASSSSASVEARIILRTIGRRSSARNMCSVRQRPMPSAPRRRGVVGVGSVVGVCAHPEAARADLVGPRQQRLELGRRARRRTARSAPRTTIPEVPSIEMTSPSWTTTPPTVKRSLADTQGVGADDGRLAPATRATTAACETRPPRAVSSPWRGEHPVDVVGRGLGAARG